jgi:hypothetical protein
MLKLSRDNVPLYSDLIMGHLVGIYFGITCPVLRGPPEVLSKVLFEEGEILPIVIHRYPNSDVPIKAKQ